MQESEHQAILHALRKAAAMFESDFETEGSSRAFHRRVFFSIFASALAGLVVWRYGKRQPIEAKALPAGPPKMVTIVEFSGAGVRQGVVLVPRIVKSDAEWHKQLSPTAFEITRRAGTEIAYTGEYWNLHEKGIYRCICCDTALFRSDRKSVV